LKTLLDHIENVCYSVERAITGKDSKISLGKIFKTQQYLVKIDEGFKAENPSYPYFSNIHGG
jgi:hypothetical protein